MNIFTDFDARVTALRGVLADVQSVEQLSTVVASFDDEAVCELIDMTTKAGQLIEQIALVASGVIGARSRRDAGHSGLAQSRGHRSPAALIQQVAGVSRHEAMRQVRVGEALIDLGAGQSAPIGPDGLTARGGRDDAAPDADSDADSNDASVIVRSDPWHAPLRVALMNGVLTAAQHDAIRQGLGEPPTVFGESHFGVDAGASAESDSAESASAVGEAHPDAATLAAWSLAAERLTADAAHVPVEELAKQARAIRDLLDPAGAEMRFNSRYEARSFRMWIDREGLSHGKFVFDDESAAWVRSIIDTALRPRRGGPRFVDPKEHIAAEALRDDPRTNDQLTHDLMVDVLKAGSVADAETVFGVRQPGIRIVQVVDRDTYLAGETVALTRLVDGGATLPQSVAAKQRCNTGTQSVLADRRGNPLDLGREQRLYTSKQRIALAARDGGCRWNGCDRPASYCEAHHIDHWQADNGRTDIDRGILLCSFHHMQLHANGWKITRDDDGPFMLHRPPESNQRGIAGRKTPSRSPDRTPATSQLRVIERTDSESQGRAVPSRESPRREQLGRDREDSSTQQLQAHVDASEPIELRPPLPLTYAWQLATPPEKRFRRAA
jgi:hypothetical protein